MTTSRYARQSGRRLSRVLAMVCTVACSMAACDVTHVTTPNVLTLSSVQTPQGAELLRAGALSELASLLSQQALWSGLLVDELSDAPAAVSSYTLDQRKITLATNNYPFESLSEARVDAINAIAALKTYAPQPAWRIAELYALLALVEVDFSENLCSGVPLSSVEAGSPVYGPALTRAQLVDHALVDLDSAAAYASASDSISALVRVVRGRALLDSGDVVDAAAAVQNVPSTFAYPLRFSATSTGQLNDIGLYVGEYGYFTVSDREGGNGLDFISGNDPRVPTASVSAQLGAVVSPVALNTDTSTMIAASGVEAQLIAAEGALAAGNTGVWAQVLNTLRQTMVVPSIAPLSADSSTSATSSLRLAVMFRERAFWMFLSGHRHGDLRRLVRQYRLPVNSVFPTGLYQGGPQTYGTAVVFLVESTGGQDGYAGCYDSNP